MAPAPTRPTAEIAALRRLAAVYRRLLLLAVPTALAGCQDAGDSLGPAADPAGPPVELTALSTPRIAFTSARSGGGDIYLTDPTGTQPATPPHDVVGVRASPGLVLGQQADRAGAAAQG